MMIHRDGAYVRTSGPRLSDGPAEVIVVKNRCGGGGYATLLYRAAYTMFQDVEPAWTPTGLG